MRAGPLTGVVGAGFYVVGALLPGSVPKPDASTVRIATFFADKRDALLTGLALELIGAGLLLVFVGYLYTTLVAANPPQTALAVTMIAAFAVIVAVVAAATLPATAIVWSGQPFPSADVIRFAYGIETIGSYAGTATFAAVSIGAPSVAIWRTGVLPRWLCALGAAEVLVNAIELAGLGSRTGADAGGYAAGIGPLLWVVWFAAASICMAVRGRPAPVS